MPRKKSSASKKTRTDPGKQKALGSKVPEEFRELVILTGISGSGKASALKAFEDLGYYCVDNMPMGLIPQFAVLVRDSSEISCAAIVVDVREGQTLDRFPELLREVRKTIPTRVLFLDTADAVLQRRYSETRRPHPFGRTESVVRSLRSERKMLEPVRELADITLDTTNFNVHELRALIQSKFERGNTDKDLLISCFSFGFKNGVPLEADLVFDVRFLPNPHFVPEFRKLTGKHPKVAAYIRNFPQTGEFLDRTTELLLFLLPYYIQEGKSYLTIAFGCTGGQHRSVMIAEEMRKRLGKEGYRVKSAHRDMPR